MLLFDFSLLVHSRLYDKLQESENASAAYIEYVTDNECSQAGDKSEVSQAYKYLANYYIKRNQVDEAYKYAHKCLDYEEVCVKFFKVRQFAASSVIASVFLT